MKCDYCERDDHDRDDCPLEEIDEAIAERKASFATVHGGWPQGPM
jgi:ribonuclease I